MRKQWTELWSEGRAFTWAILCVAAMPLLPEYGAPVCAVLSVCFAYRDARRRGESLCIGTLGKLLVLYILYMGFGVFYSQHRGNSLATWMMWVVMFLLYLTLTTVLTNRRRTRLALYLFVAAVGGVGAIACAQYVLRSLLGFTSLPNQFWLPIDNIVFELIPMNIDLTMGIERAAGTFNNPNILAEFFVMVIPLAIYCGFYGNRTPQRLWNRMFAILAVFGAVISFSRGAYLALLSMLLLLVLTHLRQFTPFMLCLVAAVSLIPEAVIGRFLSIGEGDTSIMGRLDIWVLAGQAILRSPLVGSGPGVSNFWEYLTQMDVSAPHSHNLILQVLIEGGFIALFLLSLVATRMLQDSLGLLNRSKQTEPIGLTFLIFAVALVVHGMVDYPFLSPKLVGTFCLMLGFFDALAAPYLPNQITPLRRTVDPIINFVKPKKKHS